MPDDPVLNEFVSLKDLASTYGVARDEINSFQNVFEPAAIASQRGIAS
jgi:hypothetical protein